MIVLRRQLFIGTVLAALAGCAAQPRAAGPHALAAADTGAPAASAPAKPKPLVVPGLTTQMLALARDDGYRPRMVDGQFRFCRVEIPVGSDLPVRQCVNTTQLKFQVLQEQQTRQNLEEGSPMTCPSSMAC